MRSLLPAALVGLVLITPVASQEADPPVLDLTSGHHNLVWRVARALAGEEFTRLEIPDPAAGQQLRLVWGKDEKVRVRAVPQGEHHLELGVHGQTEVLGKIAAEILGPARRLLHVTTFMTLTGQMEMEGRHAARAIQSAMEFHRQLQDLHLSVQKIREPDSSYVVDLWLKPRPGTWLQEVVGGIEASKGGAPHLRSPNATLTVTAAAEGRGLVRFLEPFADHLGLLRGHHREEREQFTKLARGRLRHFDGCFGLMIDGPGRYVRMIGLSKPEEYRGLARQKAVQAFDCRRAGRADVVIAEGGDVPQALLGSGLNVLLKETDPFAFTEEKEAEAEAKQEPEVRLATFAGVVEDFSIKARLPEDGKEMARLAERIRREQLRRMPLLGGALLRVQVNLGRGVRLRRHRDKEFAEAIKPFEAMLGELWRQVPENLDVVLYRQADRLHLQVQAR